MKVETMNKEQATCLVDKWAKDWRTYLDGQLHRGPRHALIDAIVAATSLSDDDAGEDLEGKPMTDAGIKAVMREVNEADQAQRAAARAFDYGPDTVAAAEFRRTAEPDPIAEPPSDPDQRAAADALALLQSVALEDRQPLVLTPTQVERFNRFGWLATVRYVIDEPRPVETVAVEPKRKPGRPPRQR